MLSPTAKETISPPLRIENKGKQRAGAKESSNSKLLSLLKEIREEMKGRDE